MPWRRNRILLTAEVRLGIETRGKRPLLSDPLKASSLRNHEHQVSMWFRMLSKYCQYSPPSKTFFDTPFGETDFSSSTVPIAPLARLIPRKKDYLLKLGELSEIIFSKN